MKTVYIHEHLHEMRLHILVDQCDSAMFANDGMVSYDLASRSVRTVHSTHIYFV